VEVEFIDENISLRTDNDCRITNWDPNSCLLCVTCATGNQRVTFFNFNDPTNLSQNFVLTPVAQQEFYVVVPQGKTMGVDEDDLSNQLTLPPATFLTGYYCP